MLTWPGAGRKWFHPRYIPMAQMVWTGHPCIPLLFLQEVSWRLRGSESLLPRPCPYTPQSSMRMPDGTYPQEIAATQIPVLTTGCIFIHLALAETCSLFLILPFPLGWGTHGWDPPMYLPNKRFSSSPLLMPTPSSSTHTRLHKKHKPKMQYMN